MTETFCPKKKAPNAGARLGGNPYMSLKSVTDSAITFGCKYVASLQKCGKSLRWEDDMFPFENRGFLADLSMRKDAQWRAARRFAAIGVITIDGRSREFRAG
jgi:hypothetical protein